MDDSPHRTSLPDTIQSAARVMRAGASPGEAFWLGVQVGRAEAARHPDALVLVFEPGLPPGERERLRALLGSLRGVAAVRPSAWEPPGRA